MKKIRRQISKIVILLTITEYVKEINSSFNFSEELLKKKHIILLMNKKSKKESIRWKCIIVIDDNQIITNRFELDNEGKLTNLINRPKKRISLYKNINIKNDIDTENKIKPKWVIQQHEIFSTIGKDTNHFNKLPDAVSSNNDEHLEFTINFDDEKIGPHKISKKQDKKSLFNSYFSQSDSDDFVLPSDFEM